MIIIRTMEMRRRNAEEEKWMKKKNCEKRNESINSLEMRSEQEQIIAEKRGEAKQRRSTGTNWPRQQTENFGGDTNMQTNEICKKTFVIRCTGNDIHKFCAHTHTHAQHWWN